MLPLKAIDPLLRGENLFSPYNSLRWAEDIHLSYSHHLSLSTSRLLLSLCIESSAYLLWFQRLLQVGAPLHSSNVNDSIMSGAPVIPAALQIYKYARFPYIQLL